jgi:hypothetical protein
MPSISTKNKNLGEVSVVKKMKDYSGDPVFKKKAEKAITFLKKNGLPKAFTKKKK